MFVIAAFLGILIRLLTRHEAERRKLGRPAALDLIASIRSLVGTAPSRGTKAPGEQTVQHSRPITTDQNGKSRAKCQRGCCG